MTAEHEKARIHAERLVKLRTVGDSLEEVIEAAGIPLSQGRLEPDTSRYILKSANYTSLRSSDPTFFFWGQLLPEGFDMYGHLFSPELGNQPIAVISNLEIPEHLRRRGLEIGRSIVTAWEQAWLEQGVTAFAVKSVLQGSVDFWKKLGYQAPTGYKEGEHPGKLYRTLPR